MIMNNKKKLGLHPWPYGERFRDWLWVFQHGYCVKSNDCVHQILHWSLKHCRYFFPTYENDNLLCQLDDDEEDEVAGGRNQVIAEDLPSLNTILAQESVRKDILSGDITWKLMQGI